MTSNLPPGWAEVPRPNARQPKELIAHINSTLHGWLGRYRENYGYDIEYAFIADGGNRQLLLAILNENQYPDQEVERGQTITLHSDHDETGVVKYEIIGTIKDLEIIMTCDDERVKTFFDSTGKRFIKDVIVQNLVADRKVERLYEEVKLVDAQMKKARRDKRQRQNEAREASTNVSTTTATTEQSGVDSQAVEKKREKARKKRQNQKQNRVERAEQEMRQHEENMKEIQKRLDEQGLDGELVDPNTEEGQRRIEEAVANGAQLCTVPAIIK